MSSGPLANSGWWGSLVSYRFDEDPTEKQLFQLAGAPKMDDRHSSSKRDDPMSQKVDVLLVEDNEDHIFLTKKAMLAANGDTFHLHIATDGEAALDFVYQRGQFADAPRPDLILLDINLPKKDGFQVLSELKNDPDYRTIPVTMLTSSDAYNDVSRCYELGSNAYVAKPTSFEEFAEKLKGIPFFWSKVAALPPKPHRGSGMEVKQ